ncbi:MAG: adenylate/guanylate cyclase domain-containing protein [Bacteroidetes bacterium]|nr:MAG: adenylate/guanylate cyclase domain-containing protein [Bacteroidota bacterium]
MLVYQMYFLTATGMKSAIPIALSGVFLFLVPLLLNSYKQHQAGKIMFMVSGYSFLTLMAYMYGKTSNMEYTFLIANILALFLFDRKNLIFLFFLLGLGLFLFFQFYYYAHYRSPLEHLVTQEVYFLNVITLFFVCYFVVKQFKYENETYQKVVLQQNDELTQQKEEIETQRNLIEAEKQKSETLLHNILPEEVAQELKEKGVATPKHYELITVLFTDFKGFTNIAEKISPTEVIENLNTCFFAFDNICDKYGLEKIKTIGDSYMCAGGLPTANTTNPVDVVKAGLEMQDFMAKWIAEKQASGEEVWELRLGIHSGEAVAGVVGKNKFAYDIWGDTVNLASRMESSGEVGKVNISETTYNLVKHVFQCTHRGAIQAKNKGEIEMYFVESVLHA